MVNEERTRMCKIPEAEFDFLGFTFGRMYSPRTEQARRALRPSKDSTPAHGRDDSRADRPKRGMATDYRAGRQVEPRAARLDELFPSWLSHYSVSGARQLHSSAACAGGCATQVR